jgi:hypothetical protein
MRPALREQILERIAQGKPTGTLGVRRLSPL